jgi:hypothetical protein
MAITAKTVTVPEFHPNKGNMMTRLILAALVAVFLCLPAYASDPCKFNRPLEMLDASIAITVPDATRTELDHEQSVAYLERFNAVAPATDWGADYLVIYEHPGKNPLVAAVIGDIVCTVGHIEAGAHKSIVSEALGDDV